MESKTTQGWQKELDGLPWPELTDHRTISAKTYQDPDNPRRKHLSASIAPRHYKPNGLDADEVWEDIDLSPSNPKALFELEYPSKENPFLLRWRVRGGESPWVYIAPLDIPKEFDRHSYTEENGLRKWENVWPDVDLELRFWPDRVGYFKIIKAPEAKHEFRFAVYARESNLSASLEPDRIESRENSLRYMEFGKARVRDLFAWDGERKQLETSWQWGSGVRTEAVTVPREAQYPLVVDTDVDYQVGAYADDGHILHDRGLYSNATYGVYFGADGDGRYDTFLRWTGVSIEGRIDSAEVHLNKYDNALTADSDINVYGDDQDNPSKISSYTNYIGRSRTTNSVSIPYNGFTAESGDWESTPDLKSIFQELVNDYTISSDAVQVFFEEDRTTLPSSAEYYTGYSYDYDTTLAAKLYITYTAGVYPKPLSVSANITGFLVHGVSRQVGASIDSTGSLTRAVTRSLSAVGSAVGYLSRKSSKILSAVTPAVGAVGRAIGRNLGVATVNGVGNLSRAVKRNLEGTAQAVSTVGRTVARTLSSAASTVSTLQRTTRRSLIAAMSTASSLSRKVGKVLKSTATAAAILISRAIKRSLTASSTAVGSSVRKTIRSLMSMVDGMGSVSRARTIQKILTASGVITSQLLRSVGRQLIATASTVGAVTRHIKRGLSASVVVAGAVVQAITWSKALTATVSASAVSIRSIGKTLVASGMITGAIRRGVTRAVKAAISSVGAATRTVRRTIAAGVGVTSSLSRGVSRTVSAAVSGIASSTRHIGRTLQQAALSVTGALSRTSRRVVSATATVEGALSRAIVWTKLLQAQTVVVGSITRQVGRALAASVTGTATQVRRTLRAIAATVSSLSSITRHTARNLAATVTVAGSLLRSAAKHLASANVGVVGNISHRLVLHKVLTATVTGVSSVGRFTYKSIQTAVTGLGSIGRKIRKAISSTLSVLSSLLHDLIYDLIFGSPRIILDEPASITRTVVDTAVVTLQRSRTATLTRSLVTTTSIAQADALEAQIKREDKAEVNIA